MGCMCYNPTSFEGKMDKKNVVIIGMMGVGKSKVSKRLAQILKKRMVSTDEIIEKKEGKKIADIFKNQGEPYFRKLERDVIKEISQEKSVIIDCGGGIVLHQDNIDDLKKNGVLINLTASSDMICERIKHKTHRPLLNDANPRDKIKELMHTREALYAQADYKINTDHKTIDQVCQEVISLLSHE